MNVRALAAHIIFKVAVEGDSLSDALAQEFKKLNDPRDQALLQAICFGVCRWYDRLAAIVDKLLDKPIKQKDLDIYMLLLVGLFQLMDMRIPNYAVVSATVDATKKLKKDWARGLVNGILRHYLRHVDEFAELEKFSHPEWMIKKIQKHYPQQWCAILEANNQLPPLALRVNKLRISRDDYLKKLADADILASIIPETESGIVLNKAQDVLQLPGFKEGDVSVQDGAAQLAAGLLNLKPGVRVLDACAAPGGKTTHILEYQVECVAVDSEKARMDAVKENLQRLHLQATCCVADVGNVSAWWDNQYFDRILLDAPCSASGVIRRHPDIKLLRQETDIANLANAQLRLLTACWLVLKAGGELLYVTCSIFPEENSEVIKKFLAQQKDAQEEKIDLSWGNESEVGRQILPGMHGMDGFYFARLKKIN